MSLSQILAYPIVFSATSAAVGLITGGPLFAIGGCVMGCSLGFAHAMMLTIANGILAGSKLGYLTGTALGASLAYLSYMTLDEKLLRNKPVINGACALMIGCLGYSFGKMSGSAFGSVSPF